MDSERLLQEAGQRIFSVSLNDAAANLAEANMTYGIAKLNFTLAKFGYEPDALFIGSPDMTITRNSVRWAAGFGYGGKVQWGDGERPLVILDAKPNACGMLVIAMSALPDVDTLIDGIRTLNASNISINGVPLQSDLHKSNHFIDLCALEPSVADVELPPYAVVMHSAAPELRGPNPLGDGLYWDDSEPLQKRCSVIDTPWGQFHILIDEDAQDYFRFTQHAADFAKAKRLRIAQELFGEFQVISNTTHQGMTDMNTIYLGCHDSCDAGKDLLPIMTRGDLPGYLFEGLPNLSDSVIKQLGFTERAASLGVIDKLRNANIIPHGAGYALPYFGDVVRVIDHGDHRCFEMTVAPGTTNEALSHGMDGTEILTDTHDLPQKYRGRQGVFKTIECGLGRMIAKLTPLRVVKV